MQRPATELIAERFSSRTYVPEPIGPDLLEPLVDSLRARVAGPFGTRARFVLIVASEQEPDLLKGLGTYGFIKGATGFIAGAVQRGPKDMEDYGYLLEQIVLSATELGLGTCWLGGTFTKSAFADRLRLTPDETMPAIVAVGHIDATATKEQVHRRPLSQRLPAGQLFFEGDFGTPMAAGAGGLGLGGGAEGAAGVGEGAAGVGGGAAGSSTAAGGDPGDGLASRLLEAVRWSPSASNKQPWRIVRVGDDWHFYLQRTKGYGKGGLLFAALRLADLQRVDMGIAMCHFELAASELGLLGHWVLEEPKMALPGPQTEYTATWRAATSIG
jgi:nitroreductase